MPHPHLAFSTARLACMFYFMAPGLAYGLITSRMPALKHSAGATEGELGVILFVFGFSALIGLTFAPRLLAYVSARKTLLFSSFGCLCLTLAVSFSGSVFWFAALMAVLGASMGLCDVTMNVEGVLIEKTFRRNAMSILHAGYNLGALAAALSGAIFAAVQVPLWVNFLVPAAGLALLLIWAQPRLLDGEPKNAVKSEDASKASPPLGRFLPALVWICGLLCVCCYVSEGSVGEWGSLYLHQEKGAGEAAAALVYASFSICSLLCRLAADRLRTNFGDFPTSLAGAVLAWTGMLAVLAASDWRLCLAGYALIGLGLAPIVPIAFSRTGAIKGIDTARATSLVSLMAYAGLLFAPPAFGLSAERFGLHAALCAVPCLLSILVVLTILLGRQIRQGRSDLLT